MQSKHLFLTMTVLLSFLRPSFAQEPTILNHGSSVQTVEFSPVNASLVASAGEDGLIKLWDLRNNTVITLRGHTRQVNSVAFSPNGELLASGGNDWAFRLWDVSRQQNIATLNHVVDNIRYSIKDVAFSPDGKTLATAGGHVKLWDVSSQTEIATLQHDEYVWTLAFSPDGRLLATGDGDGAQNGGEDGTVTVWDVQNRQVITQLEGDADAVYSVAFSPDSRTLASAGFEGQIKLWSVANWELLGTFQNPGTAYTVDFSRDGSALASTGHQAVTLWSPESGENIASLTGHTGWVNGVAFSPDGTTIASGGNDSTVRLQNIEPLLRSQPQRDTVRLIYFLPRDRSRQQGIDTKMNTLMRDVQQFFAEQMNNHGLGGKTFTLETDTTGQAVVHHVDGQFTDRYYHNDTFDKAMAEIEERFDLSKNIYLMAIDISTEFIDTEWCGRGGVRGIGGGVAIIPASGQCFNLRVTAHELGHAFGLDHDFRDDAYIMSYGRDRVQLSECTTEWLDAHRYFNTSETYFDHPARIKMLPPVAYSPDTIRLCFEVTDTDGLHQAQLIIPTTAADPTDGVKLHGCKSLDSGINLIKFFTTELTPARGSEVSLRVIDGHGNFTQEWYPIRARDIVPDISTEYLLSVPAGISLIHVPLEVTSVNGAAKKIESVTDLYNALGGADTVNFLITQNRGSDPPPITQNRGSDPPLITQNRGSDPPLITQNRGSDLPIARWRSYLGDISQGTLADPVLTADKGIIAVMKAPVSVYLQGNALGTNGNSSITLHPGTNLVGLPLKDSRITRVSDLLNLEGIRGNVPEVIISDNGTFEPIAQAGDNSDIPLTGGSAFILIAQQAATVPIFGNGWTNLPGIAATPPIALTGIQANNTTPVLAVTGSIRAPQGQDIPQGQGILPHLTGTGLHIIIKNLSTGKIATAMTDDQRVGYQLTFVDIETGHAAQIGDILQITAQSPDPRIRVHPLHHTITTEDINRSHIQLSELIPYEIPTNTELLHNYPNPFNPETWIPYRLAKDANVTLTIYDRSGGIIRNIHVGHQLAAIYESRAKAIHWNGRNELGEQVASGIYFYHLSAGNYSATRKMVILK